LGARPLHMYRDGTSLMTTLHGAPGWGWGRLALTMLGFAGYSWDVWHIATNGERRSVAEVPGLAECGPESDQSDAAVCVVTSRAGILMWSFPHDGAATSLGRLSGPAGRWDIGANGRIAAVSYDGSMLMLVDATTKRGIRMALGDGVRQQGTTAASPAFTADVAVASDVVATLITRDGKSELTFYRVK
jgi:hypothetical protein